MNDMQSRWLLALLVVWAGLLFGGFILGHEQNDHTRRMPVWTRMGASFALVVSAWSWLAFVRSDIYAELALFIAVGVTLGFVGDLFMAQLIPARNNVLGGIGAFSLGHLVYISGLLRFANQVVLGDVTVRWIVVVFWWAAAAIAWYVVVYRGARPTFLHFAALIYSLLLASTVGVASGVALQLSEFVPLAVGAVLFLLSDLILAAQLFNNLRFRLISDVVWLIYSPAQMLIVFALPLYSLFS